MKLLFTFLPLLAAALSAYGQQIKRLPQTNNTAGPTTSNFLVVEMLLHGTNSTQRIDVGDFATNIISPLIPGGGGGGEANTIGSAGATNAARIATAFGKSGVQLQTRSVSGGDGLLLTNESTNVSFALNSSAVLRSQSGNGTNATLRGVNLPALRTNRLAVVDPTGNLTNSQAIYVEAAQSNLLVNLVAEAPAGSLIQLGPGTFALSTWIDFVNEGVTLKGSGRDVTTITTPSAGLAVNASSVVQDLSVICPTPVRVDFYEVTNALFERLYLRGGIDVFFPGADPPSAALLYTVRDCVLVSSYDFIILGSAIRASSIVVENCTFIEDMLTPLGLGQNNGRLTRFFTTGGSAGGTLHVRNSVFTYTNALAPNLFEFDDSFNPASCGVIATFDGITFNGAVTNGGRAIPWEFSNPNGGTNSSIRFSNTPQFTTTTNAVSYTNLPGPEIAILTSTATRTNYLPNISFGGAERHFFPITVKDGAGNGATNYVYVVPLGGARIDGASSFVLRENFGSVTLQPRPGTTNWMVVQGSAPAGGPVEAMSLAVGGDASVGGQATMNAVTTTGPAEFQGPMVNIFLTSPSVLGLNASGDVTNVTIGSGLSLVDTTLSATGGSGTSNFVTSAHGSATVTNGLYLGLGNNGTLYGYDSANSRHHRILQMDDTETIYGTNNFLHTFAGSEVSPQVDNVMSFGNVSLRWFAGYFGEVFVTDEAYAAGWNGDLSAPTKNAVYDKIEALSGVGEVNVNGEAAVTNATRMGWVYDKSGVTNRLRSLQAGYGAALTNESTNIMVAVDAAVIPSHTQLNAASNVLRTDIANLQGATNGLTTRASNLEGATNGLNTGVNGLLSRAVTNTDTRAITLNTNLDVLGTNRARWLRLDGGQTASRALVLDANTNVTVASGTPDGTKFLRDDNTYAVPAGGGGSTNTPIQAAGNFFVTNQYLYYALEHYNGSNGVTATALTNNWDMSLATFKNLTNAIGTNRTFTISNVTAGASLFTAFKNAGGYSNKVTFLAVSGVNLRWLNWSTNGDYDIQTRAGFNYTVQMFANEATNVNVWVSTDDSWVPVAPVYLQGVNVGLSNVVATNLTVKSGIGYEAGTLAGVGGANTNFTGQAANAVIYLDGGTTNVNFVAIMPGANGIQYFPTYIITNLTATARAISLSSVTNRWVGLQQYDGVTLPLTLTNKHTGWLSVSLLGTNAHWAFKQATNGF
jgi:hypothetical protein